MPITKSRAMQEGKRGVKEWNGGHQLIKPTNGVIETADGMSEASVEQLLDVICNALAKTNTFLQGTLDRCRLGDNAPDTHAVISHCNHATFRWKLNQSTVKRFKMRCSKSEKSGGNATVSSNVQHPMQSSLINTMITVGHTCKETRWSLMRPLTLLEDPSR